MKDHDILVYDKDGKIKDTTKGDENKPRPHADGCVGCRRESVCIRCGERCELNVTRCVSGACNACCDAMHRPHEVKFKIVTHEMETKEALEHSWKQ